MIGKETDESRSINLPHNPYEAVDYEVFTVSSATPSPENHHVESPVEVLNSLNSPRVQIHRIYENGSEH